MPLPESARRRSFSTRILETRQPASITDRGKLSGEIIEFMRAAGIRSNVAVPMLREGEAMGVIVVNRREPHATTPEEIQLLETFAAQAVIAIENTRLFNETEEGMEQQTAISEEFREISMSAN